MPDYDGFDDPRVASEDEAGSLDVFEDADTKSTADGPERDPNAVRRPGRPQRDPNERPVDETVDTTEHAPEGTKPDTTELTGRDLSGRPTGLDALGIHSQGFGAPSSGGGEDPRGVEARRGKVGDGPPTRGRDPRGERDSRGRYTDDTSVDPDDVDTSDGGVLGRRGFHTKFDAQSKGGDNPKVETKTKVDKDGIRTTIEKVTDRRADGSTIVYDTKEQKFPSGTSIKTTTVTEKDKDGNPKHTDGRPTEVTTVKTSDGKTETTVTERDQDGKVVQEKTTETQVDPKTTPVDPIVDDPAPSIYDPLTGEIPIEVQREMDLKLGIGVAHDEPGHNTAEGDGRGVRIRYPDESDGGGKPYVDPTLINPVNPAVEQELTPPGSEELTVGAVDLVTDPAPSSAASPEADGGIAPTAPTTPPTPDPVAAAPEAPVPQVGPGPAEAQPGDFAGPAPGEEPEGPVFEDVHRDGEEPGFNDDAI